MAIHLELFAEERILARDLYRAIDVTKRTAGDMLQRIRGAITVDESDQVRLARRVWPSDHKPDRADPKRLLFASYMKGERQRISAELAARFR